MADHLQLAGSSAQIASEDITGIHYQRVKLIDGTVGSTTALPLGGDLTNGIDVDVTRVSGTVAVSGTFWQTTQPVSLATAPSTPVTGTFWQATQPVSAASLPLPAGAATAAKQPALGTSGTASADVITVQGAAGMVKLLVTPDNEPNFDVALSTRLKAADTLAGVTTVTTVSAVTAITNALPAGANVIGKVGIDQTTPGTTNLVSIGSNGTVTLLAGTAEIGNVKNSGTFAVQAALNAETTKVIGTINIAAGQTMAVTNAGTFATQATLAAETTKVIGTVNIAAGQAVTANAGTNLNTSALALEAGGNLATVSALSKAEDAASADGATGILNLAVRQDFPDTNTSANLDYSAVKTDSKGRLWINSDILGAKLEDHNVLLKLILSQLLIQNELLAAGLNIPGGTDSYKNDPFYTIN